MTIKRLVLATHNRHKAQELEHALAALPYRVLALSKLAVAVTLPAETGDDFQANARLKARAVFDQTGEWSLADDSGLCVDALGGEPGVRSARYAGEPTDDAANNARLLQALEGVSDDARTAVFVCALCLVTPTHEHTFVGECPGRIGTRTTGTGGFGYDPLFIPEGHPVSFGEMTSAAKASLSHRHHAVNRLTAYLRQAAKELGREDGSRRQKGLS